MTRKLVNYIALFLLVAANVAAGIFYYGRLFLAPGDKIVPIAAGLVLLLLSAVILISGLLLELHPLRCARPIFAVSAGLSTAIHVMAGICWLMFSGSGTTLDLSTFNVAMGLSHLAAAAVGIYLIESHTKRHR